MGCVLRISRDMWHTVEEHVQGSRDERMAYLLARATRWNDLWSDGPTLDLLVTRAIPVPDEALTIQNGLRVEIAAWLTREVLVACYETGLSLVDVHSHPFASGPVRFSGPDVVNMRQTHTDFLTRVPDDPPTAVASLVVGRTAVAGAYTDHDGDALRRLDRLVVLGDSQTEVPLCRC